MHRLNSERLKWTTVLPSTHKPMAPWPKTPCTADLQDTASCVRLIGSKMLDDVLILYLAHLDTRHWASRAETTSCHNSTRSTMRGGMSDACLVGGHSVENNKVRIGGQHNQNEQQSRRERSGLA